MKKAHKRRIAVVFTLKVPSKIVADDIHIFYHLSNKVSLDISCELSAWLMIHTKCQDNFF